MEEKNQVKYYYITEKGKELDLKSESLFLEEKEVLQILEKQSVPCSVFKLKMLLEEKSDRSWLFVDNLLKQLKEKGLVELRE